MANLNIVDFESAKRWIKVDIFQQDFVFLPVILRYLTYALYHDLLDVFSFLYSLNDKF